MGSSRTARPEDRHRHDSSGIRKTSQPSTHERHSSRVHKSSSRQSASHSQAKTTQSSSLLLEDDLESLHRAKNCGNAEVRHMFRVSGANTHAGPNTTKDQVHTRDSRKQKIALSSSDSDMDSSDFDTDSSDASAEAARLQGPTLKSSSSNIQAGPSLAYDADFDREVQRLERRASRKQNKAGTQHEIEEPRSTSTAQRTITTTIEATTNQCPKLTLSDIQEMVAFRIEPGTGRLMVMARTVSGRHVDVDVKQCYKHLPEMMLHFYEKKILEFHEKKFESTGA